MRDRLPAGGCRRISLTYQGVTLAEVRGWKARVRAGRAEVKREAVGYLKGRGGAETLTPVEAQAEVREAFAVLRQAVDELEAQALASDDVMASVGKALERSQPRMYRELAVRWWRKQTGGKREPVLVRLDGGAGGRLKLAEVGRGIKLRRDRGFGLNADLAREAVAGFWAVASVRAEVMELVRELRRVAGSGARRRGDALARWSGDAERIRRDATQRLRDVGYEIPPEEEDEPGSAGDQPGPEDWSDAPVNG